MEQGMLNVKKGRQIAASTDNQQKGKSFWSHLIDISSSPEDIELTSVPSGREGMIQDRENIRSYFEKAYGKIGS